MKLATVLFLFAATSFYGFGQSLKWSTFIDTSTTFSSPRAIDLNTDGVLDIIIGGGLDGQPESNGVNAINGATGNVLWNFATDDEMFGSAKFMDISGDGIEDVFIGGRYAEFYAINGSTGAMIWEFFPYPSSQAVDSGWFNFYNPQFVPDQNSDGMPDILVANGGDPSAPPWDTLREPGMLMVLDAMTGIVLAKDTMPDGEETYCAPTVVEFGGQTHIFYGSGGEHDKGGLWRTTLTDLMADNLESSVLLVSDPSLGFIAPSSIADMNGDGVFDIINQAYDGTVRCFHGGNNSLIWQVENPGTESSAGTTIGNFIGDGTPDVFGVVYKGAAPNFTDFYQILIDGETGSIVWKDSLGSMHYGSSSAVDLDMNGRDEAIVSLNYHNGVSFSHQVVSIDFQNDVISPLYLQEAGVNLAATPLIEDLDDNGYLDFVFAYRADSLNPMGANGFYVKCLEGTNTIPPVGVAWGGYQGTESDDHYNYTGTPCGAVTVSSNFQNISCNGFADAMASVTPTAGVAPYTYLWNTGDVTNAIDSMNVGGYVVRVTDSTGCYVEATFIATDPHVISFGGIAAPGCPGDSTGLASVSSSGCPCMFSTCGFDWASGDTLHSATSLFSGWNVVTITHMDGCIVVDSVLVPEAIPVLDSVSVGEIICASDPHATSSIELHLNDSTNTLVNWSSGETTVFVDSLDAGTHYVNLNDTVRGCLYSDSVSLVAPDTLDVSINLGHVDCFGDSTGWISATASGGVPAYNFTWSNGPVTYLADELQAGFYDLIVQDSIGCVVSLDDIEIMQSDQIVLTIANYWNDSIGTCDGGAVVTMQGGVNPYDILWDDPMATANDTVTGLCEGTYEVTITDSLGCISTAEVIILNTLSINELANGYVQVYPNPSEGIIHIQRPEDALVETEFWITDNSGKLVYQGVLNNAMTKVDISDVESGVYYLSISENKQLIKLLKN